MCAAVAKTSDEKIVAAALTIVARDGADALSLAAVAATVGIKAPSLYKRFADRAALLAAVRDSALGGLGAALQAATRHRDPPSQIRAMARAYRRFGRAEPQVYRLVMGSGDTTDAARAAIAPLFDAVAGLAGRDAVLPAARCLTAYLHGFVSMEINGSFQLGGSVDRAFDFGLDAILAGLQGGQGSTA